MKQVDAARSTVEALKRSAMLAVGVLVALCAISVAASVVSMRASVNVAQLAVLSNEQRQLWAEFGRLVLYRPPPQTNASVEQSLLAELRKDAERLLVRSQDVEEKIRELIDAPSLRLVLLFNAEADWKRMRANANVSVDLQRKFAELRSYPAELLVLGMETWGSEMQVAVASGTYLQPLDWLSDRNAKLAAVVQWRTTIGLAIINLLLIAGSILGWRRILLPTFRQWEQGQLELLQTTEEVAKRSAQFQGAFRAIADAACLLGDDGRILYVNFEFSRLFKVSANEARQRQVQDVIRDAGDRSDIRGVFDFSNTAQGTPDENWAVSLDGRIIRLADHRNIVVRLSRASLDSWLFIAQIQGDAERNLAKKLHDEHLRQIGVYTTGVAHDLNNMLATISGRLKLFRATPATKDNTNDFLRRLDATVLRGVSLVSDMLKFSRSSTLQPVYLTASQLQEELTDLVSVGKNVTFKVERSGEFLLHIDRSQFISALENICKNSLDAIGDKPGTLTVELYRAPSEAEGKPSGYASVVIQDSGGGFSQAALERAFDPFFSTKGFGKGTGLGLAIVKSFVEQSGGSIQIRNVDSGARLEIILPAIDSDRSFAS